MRSSSLPYALILGLALSVACQEDVQNDIFDPTATDSATSGTTGGTDASATSDGVTTGITQTTGETGSTTHSAESSSTTDDSSSGAICGDGVITGNEECDCGGGLCTAEQLGNTQCEDLEDPLVPGVLTGGTLGCNPASCRFDTSECTYCGDGEVNGNEGCEPNLEITQTCESLGAGTLGDLTCDRTCQLDTTACTDCGYRFDFDPCPQDWTTDRTTAAAAPSSWACGNADAYMDGPGPTTTGVWATNLTGPYATSESSALVTPPLDLTNCEGEELTMTLEHWFNFQGGVANGDGGIVQVSTNGGDNWTTLVPTGGAQYGVNPIDAEFPPVNDAMGFDGQGGDEQVWAESTFDMTPYAGTQGVQLRFVMGSNSIDNTESGGWYLEALEIIGSGG